jgi:hypothetical protein
MENKNKFDFRVKRRKLFITAGAGAGAYLLNKIFPFNFTGSKLNFQKADITVKINPKAVSRNKTGKNNV